MSHQSVLVAGAGITGPVLAYFLAKAGIQTTIIERAPTLRTSGQQIDVRGAGLEVVRLMKVEDAIRAHVTEEQGVAFVDSNNTEKAKFPVGDGQGFSSDIEIVRGDLVSVLVDAAKKAGVQFMFDDYVSAAEEQEDSVQITFGKSGRKQSYSLLIAADGLGSSTASVVLGKDVARSAIHSLGQYTAYFTIPFLPSDGTWARWYNAPGGRCVFIRPDNAGHTRCYLSIMSRSPEMESATRANSDEQKTLMRRLFADAGWETPRVLDGMDAATDFYMQQNAQVKRPAWSHNRTAFVGDAAYCPSPISGMGTSVGIVGAYVLAGEIVKASGDYKEAFRRYEELFRPYVERAQKLPPGAPGIANPQTKWGIWILNAVLGFVTWSGVTKLLGGFEGPTAKFDGGLPDYNF